MQRKKLVWIRSVTQEKLSLTAKQTDQWRKTIGGISYRFNFLDWDKVRKNTYSCGFVGRQINEFTFPNGANWGVIDKSVIFYRFHFLHLKLCYAILLLHVLCNIADYLFPGDDTHDRTQQ